MVVEDGQSLHSFSFTVKLQQTRQSLRAGCWDEDEEEEMERKEENDEEDKMEGGKKLKDSQFSDKYLFYI